VIWAPSKCRACAKCLVVFGSRLDCFNISTYPCSHCQPKTYQHTLVSMFNDVIHHEVCIVLLLLLFSRTGPRNLCSVWGALYSVYRIMTATGIGVYCQI
jgi:hypothetical protein